MTAGGVRVGLTLEQYEALRAVNPDLPEPGALHADYTPELSWSESEWPRVNLTVLISEVPEGVVGIAIPEWTAHRDGAK